MKKYYFLNKTSGSKHYHIYKASKTPPKNMLHIFLAEELPICSKKEELRIVKDSPVLKNNNYIYIEDNEIKYNNDIKALDICKDCLLELSNIENLL